MYEQVRATLKERIEHGATLEEIEMIVLKSHGLRPSERRELEVARLVAVGRTDREIARDLFLSPRTVDMHLRNILRKLDCRSRVEAAGKAHSLGLVD